MTGQRDLENALHTTRMLHEAAFTPHLWDEVLHAIADEFDLTSAQFNIVNTTTGEIVFKSEVGTTDVPLCVWTGCKCCQFAAKNTSLPKIKDYQHKVDLALLEHDLFASKEPSLRKVSGPPHFDHALVWQHYDINTNYCVLFGLLRTKDQGRFYENDLDKFRLYQTHIHQAVKAAIHVFESKKAEYIFHNIFDTMQLGMLVVDQQGYLHFANETAQHLIEKNVIFQINPYNKFVLTNARHKSDLLGHLDKAINRARKKPNLNACQEYYMRIDKDGCEGGLLLIISALQGNILAARKSALPKDPLAIIHIIDTEEVADLDPVRLQNAFNITATEADVLRDFADGKSPKEIAKHKQRSYYTIRNHLQKIMSKTNIHRQAELIRLIYTIMNTGRSIR